MAKLEEEEKGKKRMHICIYLSIYINYGEVIFKRSLSNTKQSWIFSNLLSNNMIYSLFLFLEHL